MYNLLMKTNCFKSYSGICGQCKNIFYCKNKEPRFCSTKCGNLSKQKRIYLTCRICGKDYYRRHSTYKQNKRHFCSYGCWYKFFNGKNCHLYKRGWWFDVAGYKVIRIGKRNVAEHVYLMEKKLGRKLKGRGKELVHHIDGNKQNNSMKNLTLMKWGEHTRLHHSH